MQLKDSTLIIVSTLISILGIIGLFIISTTTDTNISFDNIKNTPDETFVTIQGTILKSDVRGNTTFMSIEGTCTLPAILFEPLELKPPLPATITGTLTSYEGEKELIIESIRT